MYDGIGTGRYCLQQLGFNNIEYYAYEIDKYAMSVANDNFPDIIQRGDAFALRNNDWNLENLRLVKERSLKQLTEAHNEYRQRAAGY